MVLKQWKDITNDINNRFSGSYETSSDIFECQRQIYMFVSKKELEATGRVSAGNAIVVNFCASRGTGDDLNWLFIGKKNAVITYMNVYNFDVEFFKDISDSSSTVMVLKSAMGSGTIQDFDDKRCFAMSYPIYKVDSGIESLDMFNNVMETSQLPNPKYYTLNHMYERENDMYNIYNVSETMTCVLSELVDGYTKIHFYDIGAYPSMCRRLEGAVRDISEGSDEKVNPYDISNSSLYTKLSAMMEGYGVIYDTHYGINILPTQFSNISMRKYRLESNVRSTLECLRDHITESARRIEEKHGPVRIHYMPFYHADKIQMRLKDYLPTNQPIIGFKQNNGSEISTKGCNIDVGSTINNEIEDFYYGVQDTESF